MRAGGPLLDDPGLLHEVLADVVALGFGEGDVTWSESCGPPTSAEAFAMETAFVICNSGMQNRIAAVIFAKVRDRLLAGGSAAEVFGHEGKSRAIDRIWADRDALWRGYLDAVDKLEFCGALPWIGSITRYHLAKNFGAPVAKPDVHLQRLAARHSTDPQTLCDELAARTGLGAATIDVVLWRACAERRLDARTGLPPRPAPTRATPTPSQLPLFEPTQGDLFD